MATSILRLPQVQARVGLSRSSIYLRVAQGTFPRPVSIGQRAVGWISVEIDKFIADQIEKSRKAAA